MTGKPAARVTDMHTCPMVTPGTPPVPHVGGPILPACSINILIGNLPAARVSDMALCVGPPDTIVHGGVIVSGMFNVLIGDRGGGPGGGGGGSGAAAAGAMIRAAMDGKPFCEECFQKALARG